jgi:hypothetical protein
VAVVPFDALTGPKAFVVANALSEIGAPKEIISSLMQQLPKLWKLSSMSMPPLYENVMVDARNRVDR